ncbi:hypothetical protein, partial [Burkholderia gladioli]|uniref:hypothetical protein n=1 Tax=Burkholderia gladioli TaxID=28095 RepID=UPI00164120A3
PIGNDRFGTDVHFLLTQLPPRAFMRSARPTRVAALEARAKALREQLTVVAFNLRNGAAKTEHYFATHDQIEAYNKQAQRAGNVNLVLKGEPQAVMVDPGMWRTLLNKLYVGRDVSTSASRFLPVPGKLRASTRRFGAATVDA